MITTIIKLVILLTILALFGGILIDVIMLVVDSIVDSVQIFSYMNTVLYEIWVLIPPLLRNLIMFSMALILIGIVLKINSAIDSVYSKTITGQAEKRDISNQRAREKKFKHLMRERKIKRKMGGNK